MRDRLCSQGAPQGCGDGRALGQRSTRASGRAGCAALPRLRGCDLCVRALHAVHGVDWAPKGA